MNGIIQIMLNRISLPCLAKQRGRGIIEANVPKSRKGLHVISQQAFYSKQMLKNVLSIFPWPLNIRNTDEYECWTPHISDKPLL